MLRSLSTLVGILGILHLSAPSIASAESLREAYVRQEAGEYGPLSCGMSVALFRVHTTKQIQERIAAQNRSDLFQTPNHKPYLFNRISLDDLITIRDLVMLEDTSRREWWDYQIREAAHAAYIRLGE